MLFNIYLGILMILTLVGCFLSGYHDDSDYNGDYIVNFFFIGAFWPFVTIILIIMSPFIIAKYIGSILRKYI